MKGNTSTELVGPSPSSSPCHGIWCSSDATPQASSQFWLNFNSSSPIYYYNYYFSFITDSNKLPSQIYSKILKPDSINLQICQMVSQANTKNFNKLHNYILPNWQPHLSWCLIKIKSEKQTVKKKNSSKSPESGQHSCNCFSWLFLLLLFQDRKKKKAIWTNLSPEKLQRTELPCPLGICQLSSAHQSKMLWGAGAWHGVGTTAQTLQHPERKKVNFLLSMKQEPGDKPWEMKSAHRGRLKALGGGITAQKELTQPTHFWKTVFVQYLSSIYFRSFQLIIIIMTDTAITVYFI